MFIHYNEKITRTIELVATLLTYHQYNEMNTLAACIGMQEFYNWSCMGDFIYHKYTNNEIGKWLRKIRRTYFV